MPLAVIAERMGEAPDQVASIEAEAASSALLLAMSNPKVRMTEPAPGAPEVPVKPVPGIPPVPPKQLPPA